MGLQTIVELLLTGIVIYFQVHYYFQIKSRIDQYAYSFPNFPLAEKNLIPFNNGKEEIKVIFIEDKKHSEEFVEIINSINKYLIKNHGAIDFEIIKSIVERNIDAKEEGVSRNISLPLYIGLMGTFLGIIVGLLNIAFFGGVTQENINSFIGGVLIAMLASFLGLLLTVINNSYHFKNAKGITDKRKNEFYNFLQIELLPNLGNSIYDVFERFKNNIESFNTKFTANINLFDEEFSSNINTLKLTVDTLADNIDPIVDNLDTQKEFLRALKGTGYNKLVEANLRTFEIMERAAPTYIEFVDKQKQLNYTVDKILQIVSVVDNVMNRVARFESGINALGERIDNADYMGSDLLKKVNQKLSDLDSQFELLKQHSQFTKGEIETHFQREVSKIELLSRKVISDLQEALNFNYAENPLLRLKLLEDINTSLNNIDKKNDTKQDLSTLISRLSFVSENIAIIKNEIQNGVDVDRKPRKGKKNTGETTELESKRSVWSRLNPFKLKLSKSGKAKK